MGILIHLQGVAVEDLPRKVALLRELVHAAPKTPLYLSMRGSVQDGQGNQWEIAPKKHYVPLEICDEDDMVLVTHPSGVQQWVFPCLGIIDHLRLYYPEGDEV